jgi:DNA-binding transcriptional MerR regulator
MFTIGEFARLGDISVRMLRHYDEIGLLAPARVDPSTGYRAYTIGQLRDLNRIVALRGLGLSLSEVRRLLDGITAVELRGMLLVRQAELERELEEGRMKLERVEARLRAIESEDEMPDDIVIKTAATQRLLAIERPIPGFGPNNIAPVAGPAGEQLERVVAAMGIGSANRHHVLCYEVVKDTEEVEINMFVGTPIDDEVIEAMEPAQIVVLPGVLVASCVRQGATHQVWPRIVNDVLAWVEQNDYVHVGPGRDYVLDISVEDPAKQVFEIQMPIRRPDGPMPMVAPQRANRMASRG